MNTQKYGVFSRIQQNTTEYKQNTPVLRRGKNPQKERENPLGSYQKGVRCRLQSSPRRNPCSVIDPRHPYALTRLSKRGTRKHPRASSPYAGRQSSTRPVLPPAQCSPVGGGHVPRTTDLSHVLEAGRSRQPPGSFLSMNARGC